jgi:hypothetical protein
MTTLTFPDLSPEGNRVMRDVLGGAHREGEPEHELPRAVRMHEGVRRWWQGLGTALSGGLEGSQARALLGVQIALCGADAIFLQVALDNAADAPQPEDVDRARAALAEARAIEAKARDWLGFASQSPAAPAEEQLARGVAIYERGETEDLKDAVARLRARRSS